tara:strand:+ start:1146 stop:1358 length:213 start_codon:yes stop_codon:yes gene_type:complete
MALRDLQNKNQIYLTLTEYMTFNELIMGNPDLIEGYIVQYLKDDKFEITLDEDSSITPADILLAIHQERD